MDRRGFLSLCGVGAALSLSGCAEQPVSLNTPDPTPAEVAPIKESKPLGTLSPVGTKMPLPEGGIYGLPGEGSFLAWTVDDGGSQEVIRRYAQFATDTGTRLTFFINGIYDGWTQHANLLRPMVKSGQVQIANHTWSHADLTSLSNKGIVDELSQNEDFIVDTFGKSSKPFYRPPYGYRNDRTDAAAAEIGFTAPTMWYGSLGDSGELTPEKVYSLAEEWFGPQRIVIGHANYLAVTEKFPELLELLKTRGLITVTLNDYFDV